MDTKYILTDVEGLVKDRESGAILNIDKVKLDAYKKKKMQQKLNHINAVRLDNMEKSIDEIKSLLEQLLKR